MPADQNTLAPSRKIPAGGRWMIACLAALNLLLGVGVFSRINAAPAFGQPRGHGEYLVVPGRTGGVVTLFVFDSAGARLLAVKQDAADNVAMVAGTADVAQDLDRAFNKGGGK